MKANLGIFIAIVAAGALIGGSLFISGGRPSGESSLGGHNAPSGNPNNYRDVTEEDHVRGDLAAPITIIEYSDFECPFCSRLHPTLSRVVEDFSDVRWVYRHFPLSSIHSRAREAAIASECVAEIAGNDAFWEFSDGLFSNQRQLGRSLYTDLASNYGISKDQLESCLGRGDVADAVDRDLDEAIATGGRGTPHSLLITPDNEVIAIPGALQYEQFAGLINQIRAN